ncbi:hypothetical protein [Planctomicrobium sp. SH527]|uniref:hypothetical protein n=1 Tax=Planctomicrobium sp. SH527 TaxID=3448123 RepID=UPI003F5C46A4
MAENEYLDATKARRWQSVAQAIQEGSSISEVAAKIEDCLHKTLRQIRKDLPLSEMIEHLHDPQKLREMCSRIEGAHDVKYFVIEAADQKGELPEKLSYFLSRSLANCLYDVPYLAANFESDISITGVRNAIRDAEICLQPEIHRIARKLAENPAWNPRRASRRETPAVKVDTTKKMLGESLLVGFRK